MYKYIFKIIFYILKNLKKIYNKNCNLEHNYKDRRFFIKDL